MAIVCEPRQCNLIICTHRARVWGHLDSTDTARFFVSQLADVSLCLVMVVIRGGGGGWTLDPAPAPHHLLCTLIMITRTRTRAAARVNPPGNN